MLERMSESVEGKEAEAQAYAEMATSSMGNDVSDDLDAVLEGAKAPASLDDLSKSLDM